MEGCVLRLCLTVGAAGGGVGDELPHGALPLQRIGQLLLPAVNTATKGQATFLTSRRSQTVSMTTRQDCQLGNRVSGNHDTCGDKDRSDPIGLGVELDWVDVQCEEGALLAGSRGLNTLQLRRPATPKPKRQPRSIPSP